MKKLLYITCNSKPESISVSKTIGRVFVERFSAANPEYSVEELDLYNENIPEINHRIFTHRAEPASGSDYASLTDSEKEAVDKINTLVDQFLSADTYVFAAPMWSISFPSRLKRYIDCILINNKTIKVSPENVEGLLDDKERNMVYIQSSGGVYPRLLGGRLNHGVYYMQDLFKFLGVRRFEKILVEGTDMESLSMEEVLSIAYEDVAHVVNKFSREALLKG